MLLGLVTGIVIAGAVTGVVVTGVGVAGGWLGGFGLSSSPWPMI